MAHHSTPRENQGKETRNRGPCNVSACDGHVAIHTYITVMLASRRIFYFGQHVYPVSTRHMISQPRLSPLLQRYSLPHNQNAHITGKAWDRGYMTAKVVKGCIIGFLLFYHHVAKVARENTSANEPVTESMWKTDRESQLSARSLLPLVFQAVSLASR